MVNPASSGTLSPFTMPTTTRLVAGQPSWTLRSSDVEAAVTVLGGQLGPVTFDRRRRRIQPFSVAPWVEESEARRLPPILRALRGDFFCLPFGANADPYQSERHPLHGETANARWKLVTLESGKSVARLCCRLATRVRPGRVEKVIELRAGQNVVYCRHTISGMRGPMCLGHHAMLRFPDEAGSGVISTSPFALGQVFIQPTERPEQRGYSWLKPAAEFDSLERVPTITGEHADLTRFPARRGFEDLAMILSQPELPFAWTAVTFPRDRFVWFAIKDPRVLRGTIFWISNGGRHYPPWNGRHVNVLGLEDITGYFHLGLAASAQPNPFSRRAFPTTVMLDPATPLAVNYIMAVALAPAGFDRVTTITPLRNGSGVELKAASGRTAAAPLDLAWLGLTDPVEA
jgi:hypothetical protein